MSSDLSDVLAAGKQFEALGEVWTLAPIGPALREQFAAWCRVRARRELSSQKRFLASDEYNEALALLDAEIAAGSYSWGSPFAGPARMGKAVQVILAGAEGQVALVQLLLAGRHGNVPADRV